MGKRTRSNPIGAYVLHRIRQECFDEHGRPIRGKQAEIVAATGFTSAMVSNVFKRAEEGGTTGRGVGHDFASALAERWWRIPFAQLEEEAKVWAGGTRASVRPLSERSAPWWRMHPAWAEAVERARAEARERGLKIPGVEPGAERDYFAMTGEAVVPGREPTVEGVIRLAELLWVTDR